MKSPTIVNMNSWNRAMKHRSYFQDSNLNESVWVVFQEVHASFAEQDRICRWMIWCEVLGCSSTMEVNLYRMAVSGPFNRDGDV